jgi:hypothetical protein
MGCIALQLGSCLCAIGFILIFSSVLFVIRSPDSALRGKIFHVHLGSGMFLSDLPDSVCAYLQSFCRGDLNFFGSVSSWGDHTFWKKDNISLSCVNYSGLQEMSVALKASKEKEKALQAKVWCQTYYALEYQLWSQQAPKRLQCINHLTEISCAMHSILLSWNWLECITMSLELLFQTCWW